MPLKQECATISGQIQPRDGATDEEREALFDLLNEWSERDLVLPGGLLHSLDCAAVWSMRLGPDPVPIDFQLHRPGGHNRSRLLAYLRTVIPHHLVADVLLEGRSWNDQRE